MANNSRKFFRSRLTKIEETKNLKKAFFFIFLTISLLVILVLFGVPTLIKLAASLADFKGPGSSSEQVDSLPPSPPRLNSLPEFTKESSLSVSGFAESNSTLEIFLNNSTQATVTTTSEGTFTLEKINLVEGKNEIYAIATDKAGNKSQMSEKITIFFDKTPPKLDIFEPQEGAIFAGERKRKIRITGQTEENVSLAINDRLVILGQEGNFSTDFTLSNGENIIKIISTDQAGNQTEKEVKVTFVP